MFEPDSVPLLQACFSKPDRSLDFKTTDIEQEIVLGLYHRPQSDLRRGKSHQAEPGVGVGLGQGPRKAHGCPARAISGL